MEYLLTLLDYYAVFKSVLGNGESRVGNLCVLKGYSALSDKTSCLTLRSGKLALYHHINYGYNSVGEVCVGYLGSGHILGCISCAEYCLCGVKSLGSLLLAVNELCYLPWKDNGEWQSR